MPKYKCSKCGATFEGVPNFCPACGALLSNGKLAKEKKTNPLLQDKPKQKPEEKVECPKVEEPAPAPQPAPAPAPQPAPAPAPVEQPKVEEKPAEQPAPVVAPVVAPAPQPEPEPQPQPQPQPAPAPVPQPAPAPASQPQVQQQPVQQQPQVQVVYLQPPYPQQGYPQQGYPQPGYPYPYPPQPQPAPQQQGISEKEMKAQKGKAIAAFILSIIGLLLGIASALPALNGLFVVTFKLKVDVTLYIAVGAALFGWICSGIASSLASNAYDVKGGVKVLRIFGKIFSIFGLIISIILTFSWAIVIAGYYMSDWIASFAKINLKNIITEFLTTGKVTSWN